MAIPRHTSARIAATARTAQASSTWREQMSERLALTTPRLDPSVEAGAACAGTDTKVFFPHPRDQVTVQAAKNICRGCPVQRACLMQALRSHDDHAILGGSTPDERRHIRRRVAAKRSAAGVAA